MNHFFRSLYAGDLWLDKPTAQNLAQALLQFIRVYLLLARKSYDLGEKKFGLIPKIHALHEVHHEMVRQGELSHWVLNPIAETCSIDEDVIGRVAILSRSVSPRAIARRALARYLAQINIIWARG